MEQGAGWARRVPVGIAATALLLTTGVVYGAFLNHGAYKRRIIEQNRLQLQLLVDSEARSIKEKLEHLVEDLIALGENPVVAERNRKGLSSRDFEGYRPGKILYGHNRDLISSFYRIAGDGRVLARLPFVEQRLHEDFSRKPGVAAVLSRKKPFVSLLTSDSGKKSITVCVPVAPGKSGEETPGVLMALIYLDTFEKMLAPLGGEGRTGMLAVAEGTGRRIVVHPDSRRVGAFRKIPSMTEGGIYAEFPMTVLNRRFFVGASLSLSEVAEPVNRHARILIALASFWIVVILGAVTGAAGYIVRSQREAARRLGESERKYRLLFEGSADSIFLESMDGEIKDCNAVACRQFGYTREELLGLRVTDLLPDDVAVIYPEFMSRGSVEGQGFIETFNKRKDGSVFPVEVSTRFVNMGEEQLLVAYVHDITERKKAEEEAYRLNLFQESVIDNASVWLSVYDESSNVTIWNKAAEAISGYSAAEVVGGNLVWEQLYPDPAYRERVGEMVRSAFRKREDLKDIETTIRSSGGSDKTLSWNVRKIRDREGKVTGVLALGREITDARKLRFQLAQAHKMEAIGTLAGGIAHDFNNILGAIMGYSELAARNAEGNEKVRRYMEQIQKASGRARELVLRILTFSRQKHSEKIPCNIGVIIKEALKLLRASLPATIEIRQDIETSGGTVRANQTEIHQVLMNLCTNAFHAMGEEGGILSVTLLPVGVTAGAEDGELGEALMPGPYLKLTVTDTGHGMAVSVRDRIFDPYFTTKEVGEGTGMGLATVHGIIREHGGAIRVQSSPGRGAAFELFFPVIEEGVKEREPTPDSFPGGNERILLVDDEKALVEMGTEMLEELGYRVHSRLGAHDALAAFKADPDRFDMLITDMTMPGMTGDRLAREILALRPGLPVLICTGFSRTLAPGSAENIGVKGVLHKPLSLRELSETVRKILDEAGDR